MQASSVAAVAVDKVAQSQELFKAVSEGNVEKIKQLAAAKADFNVVDEAGLTPLLKAVLKNDDNAMVVGTLVKGEAQLSAVDPVANNTALHYAALQENMKICLF